MRPDAGSYIIVNFANKNIISLLKSNGLEFCGGANDFGKNNSTKALKYITDIIKANNHTYIILVTVPPRYDLMQS